MIFLKIEAIGVVETQFFAIALEILDQMTKNAQIKVLSKESTLGGKLVTVIVGGSISDITEAIDVAKELGIRKHAKYLKNAIVITKPHKEIMKYITPQKEASDSIG